MLMKVPPPEYGDWRFPEDMPFEERKKIRAACHYKIQQALKKGTIKRPDPPCPVCLSKTDPLVSHHWDYRKPLEVLWVCKSCHYKHHHLPNFFRFPMAGEIEELDKAAYQQRENPKLAWEAYKKLFLYPWPVPDPVTEAEKAARYANYLKKQAEDEKLYGEMEKAEEAWLEACDGGDEKAIAAAEQNLEKAQKGSKIFGPNTRHEGE